MNIQYAIKNSPSLIMSANLSKNILNLENTNINSFHMDSRSILNFELVATKFY